MEEAPTYSISQRQKTTIPAPMNSSPKTPENSQPYQKPYTIVKITTALDIDPANLVKLNSYIIQFSHLCSLKSEHMAIARIYDNLNTQKELTSEDIDFLKGMLITLRERYIRNKQIAQAQPQNYSSHVMEYYNDSIANINNIFQNF